MSPNFPLRFFRIFPFLALVFPALAWADRDVTVIVDMTKDGRKLPVADPAHVQYYQPLIGGYKELGDPIPGLVRPSVHDVVHIVATELLKRGYHVIDGAHPKPDILLDISWGVLTPTEDDDNVHNKIERYNLVMGHTIANVMPVESYQRGVYLDAANDERYFIILSAYGPPASPQDKKRINLWQAKMSVPMGGVNFDQVMTKMVQAGAPSFGIETNGHPKIVDIVPDGQVSIGKLEVKPDTPAPPAK